MMYQKIILAIAFLGGILSCSDVKVYTDRDKNTELRDYHTYQWEDFKGIEKKAMNPLYYNELNDTRIKAAVTREMNNNGFNKVDAGGELVLHYHIILESKATPISDDFEDDQYSPHWSRPNVGVYQYTEGTLIIDLMDEAKNTIVWRGWIVGVVDASNMIDSETAINKAVALIFEKFPK